MGKPLGYSPEETFWYWIRERHNIFLKRQAGDGPPWTDDPILQIYRFCNPFRENDKVTRWQREVFFPQAEAVGATDELLAFNLVWFRQFNRIKTAELLGFQTDWDPDRVKSLLKERAKTQPVFTGAFIIRSEFGKGKIDSIVDLLTKVWEARSGLVTCIRETNSIQLTTQWLTRFPYIGDFMAYEMVTDMRHTRLLENAVDIMTWANPGPGAERGLAYLYGEPRMKKDGTLYQFLHRSEMVPLMKGLLDKSEGKLGPDFPKMEMRDIEHSLCEVFKYQRGFSRQRYPGGIGEGNLPSSEA